MNIKHTLEHLQDLKLYGMLRCFENCLNQSLQSLPDATLAAMMAEAEAISKVNQRTRLYLRLARERYVVLPEQIHCGCQGNLPKEQLLFLSELLLVECRECA